VRVLHVERLDRPAQVPAGARSRAYALLAAAFDFPAEETARAIVSGEWAAELAETVLHLPFAFDIPDELLAAGRSLTPDGLQQEYIRLFDVGRGRPPCPLYEGGHRSGRMRLMEELVRFYNHFGLKADTADRPDHLCAELEFMHYLSFKHALAADDPEHAAGLLMAQRDFLTRHLCRWLPKVKLVLASLPDTPGFYASLVALADDFCRTDLGYLNGCQENPDPPMRRLPD
jgi:putative dimethyl sulfoxide reductase chaperone